MRRAASRAEPVPSDTARFSTLLATLLVLFLVAPLSRASGPQLPLFEVAFSLILISGVYAVSRRPPVFWVGLSLAVPALLLEWASLLTGARAAWLANFLFSSVFMAWVFAALFANVLRRERVTADTIAGGVCVYLLLGALFMEFYHLIELMAPGSFARGGISLSELGTPGRVSGLLYFSFVTLTTLGYGDIVPINEFARSLAVVEAVVGQLYVAVFVARLVALHVSHPAQGRD